MKSFYACLDTAFVKYVPQPLQHLAIHEKARKLGGQVSYYTMEDITAMAGHGSVRAKIDEDPVDEGIIYFTLRQFCYGESLDLTFLRYILDKGYGVHFAREDISIFNTGDLDSQFPMLYSTQQLWNRDDDQETWRSVWEQLTNVEQDQLH